MTICYPQPADVTHAKLHDFFNRVMEKVDDIFKIMQKKIL